MEITHSAEGTSPIIIAGLVIMGLIVAAITLLIIRNKKRKQ
jgi:hypothetical protein